MLSNGIDYWIMYQLVDIVNLLYFLNIFPLPYFNNDEQHGYG